MADRQFRFGIIAAQARSAAEWTGLARRVAGLGYQALMVPDTIHTLAPAVACAVAATAAESLVVGPYVLSVPNRSPGQIALETATLQTLTDGRYQLGLGPGRPGADTDAAVFERPFGSAADRLKQVAATVSAVRERSPRTPIMIAAGGPHGLRQAGALADVVAFGLPPLAGDEQLDRAVQQVRAGAGDRLPDLELSQNLLAVGDEEPSWLPRANGGLTVAELRRQGSIAVLSGSTADMVDTLQRRREATGISFVCVSAAFADQLAPVVAVLAGH